jgi:formylglycine-generating enzyme required for sulfatase activity
VRVLATVRGDFLSRLATLPPIVEELSRALYFLRPLSAERIREAIVGPAAAKGVTFENDELVDTLVASTARAGGGLPLLQFALSELWNVRDRVRQVITAQALEAVGGVAGALSRHADDLLARMLPAEREAARVILLRLVTPDNTRARRTEDELVTEGSRARAALDALVQGRLVVASESAEGTGFEIAHEALLSGWGTLARWLSQDADLRVVRERLLRAAADWERLGRRRDLLWGHRQLVEADGLRAAGLTEREARFVEASRAAARRSRVLRMAAIASVPAVVLLAYGGAKLKAARDNDRRVDSALAHIDAALASAREQHAALHAIRKLAFDQFDEPNVVEAEKTWARVRSSQADLSRAFSRIAQEVEAALALAPERKDVRARLADVLYERALFAEERHAASERDELLDRLTLYDATEERLARWNAPASVSLVVTPDAATVRLARYESSESGLRIEVPVATVLNETPRPLARGSYVVTVEASGFAKVRYPFRVERGEEARFAIDLPRADDVPNGFVFVPPGRFLFGSQEEDSLRRSYYHTVPLHTATTGAYLIAVHETTFGDWIEYLRALPPEERASRFPEVKGGFQGALAWKAVEGGRFEVTFQPASHKFTLREGELVTYPGRTGRAAQDWRRFPVSGVGAGDADAYAKWLDATGKVRGARLCTELEWQRAARGADDRHFPHGDALAPDHANFDDTYDKAPLAMGPDEVGSHPLSQSPFGIDDAAGNVWEWTVSSLGKGEHAAVGGSYYFSANSSRVSNREVTEPSFRDVSVGFRICADAPRAETARHAPSAR